MTFRFLLLTFLLSAVFVLTKHQNCYFVLDDYELKSYRLDYGNISGQIIEKGNAQKNICPRISVSVQTYVPVERVSMELNILLSSSKCSFCHKAVSVKIDFCKLFKNVKSKTPRGYILMVFRYLLKVGSLPDKCPVPPTTFHLNNVSITREILPTHMPLGPIKFQMWIYAKNKGEEVKLALFALTGEVSKNKYT